MGDGSYMDRRWGKRRRPPLRRECHRLVIPRPQQGVNGECRMPFFLQPGHEDDDSHVGWNPSEEDFAPSSKGRKRREGRRTISLHQLRPTHH